MDKEPPCSTGDKPPLVVGPGLLGITQRSSVPKLDKPLRPCKEQTGALPVPSLFWCIGQVLITSSGIRHSQGQVPITGGYAGGGL